LTRKSELYLRNVFSFSVYVLFISFHSVCTKMTSSSQGKILDGKNSLQAIIIKKLQNKNGARKKNGTRELSLG